ncbi:hypothetical protein FHS16_004579 [Paenibacillus endophyticus]|uniref:Uncharacterized protein n=1 Tax=Paenibacillus endophyticus TaxID=1294268 RepID=A0A7W5GCZ1_9BACL|nr:hypothetical protein [Paenibacillus endophyticus]MBB3154497.1 hypothetical protein [Paenibacillus endophyticus]
MSSMYDKIGTYLTQLDVSEIQLCFEKLDEITGGLAPSSKYDRT